MNPMMPYQGWNPPDEWFDSPEWVVMDAFLNLRVDEMEFAPLPDTLDAVEDGHLALLALRNRVRSDDFAVIGGKLYALERNEEGEWQIKLT